MATANSIFALTLLMAATCPAQGPVLHQQSGTFLDSDGGIITDQAGTTRGPEQTPFEFIAIHHGYEHVGFCDGGVGANQGNFVVEGIDLFITDADGGVVGSPGENDFDITVYPEDLMAPPGPQFGAAVNPDIAARQVVGPFSMPNTTAPGVAETILFQLVFPTPIAVSRAGTGPASAGTLFTGVAFGAAPVSNALLIGFLSSEDLTAQTMGSVDVYDLPNQSVDPSSGATSAGHGLSTPAACGAGYAYADDTNTVGLDFFDTSYYLIAPTARQAGFKTLVETSQNILNGTGTGNLPLSNAAPGGGSPFSSRRPVNAQDGDCRGGLRSDNLFFRYINQNISPSASVVIFASFGQPLAVASLQQIQGWDGMVCFADCEIAIRSGTLGSAGSGEFVTSLPIPAMADISGNAVVFTGIAMDSTTGTIHAGSCERVLF